VNQAEIAEANTRVEELEESNKALEQGNADIAATMVQLQTANSQQSREIDSLRSRATLSQQNWLKERDELIRLEAVAREEYETARVAMQDWEVLAMEERSMRENLRDKVAELETQLGNIQETHEKVVGERDSQSQTVDGLQRALRDIQEGTFQASIQSTTSSFKQNANEN
jgi:chromosome segregation ATPase